MKSLRYWIFYMTQINWDDTAIEKLGYDVWRILPDSRFLAVSRMTFGKGRLYLCSNIWGPDESYCYATYEQAISQMLKWNPDEQNEPEGWIRHLESGRRRPNGDPDQEYVQW